MSDDTGPDSADGRVQRALPDAAQTEALAGRIRAAGAGQLDAYDRSRQLPVLRPRRAVILPADGRTKAPLPVVVRRAAGVARDALRHPAVAASATAMATVGVQVGLRLLEQRVTGQRATGRSPLTGAVEHREPVTRDAWVRVVESHSLVVERITRSS